MPILKVMKSVPTENLAAEGLFAHDYDALTDYQRAAVSRFVITLQLEQESYMTHHPEVISMMELLIKEFAVKAKLHCDFMKEAANFFLRPGEELEDDIRGRLKIGPEEKFSTGTEFYDLRDDEQLKNDLINIMNQYQAPDAWTDVHTTPPESTPTKSSSFASLITSTTTLPTPEVVTTPELTVSEFMLETYVKPAFNKAVFLHVTTRDLIYDTYYVELALAVEIAMEIPVVPIREMICDMLYAAWENFEKIVTRKERIEAQILWQNRMKKKMKKTLREHSNFRGYETVSPSKGSLYKELGYKVPHPPCMCYARSTYNRIPKDRHGVYLPREEKFDTKNITISPVTSFSSEEEQLMAMPVVPVKPDKAAKFTFFDKSLLQRTEILKRRQFDYGIKFSILDRV